MMIVWVLSLFVVSLAQVLHSGESHSVHAVQRLVDNAIRSGECDLSVAAAIRTLPKKSQIRFAGQLLAAPHAAMRREATRILQRHPGQEAAAHVRKLLTDESYENRLVAAVHLAKEANDAEARATVLALAHSKDPAVAEAAVRALGRLKGDDVSKALQGLLQQKEIARCVLVSAIVASGESHATDCIPALRRLLAAKQSVQERSRSDMRICDLAAQGLQLIYGVDFLGTKGGFPAASVAERDDAIE